VNFSGKYYSIKEGRLNTPFVAPERASPEIYLGGNSEQAEPLAARHAQCLWRFAEAPATLRPRVRPLIEQGTEVGLLVSLLARETREEAVRDAYDMIAKLDAGPRKAGKEFAQNTDSISYRSTLDLAERAESQWLTPYLWAGAVPYLGAPSIALVGGREDIVSALMEYRDLGISQFLFIGWPDMEEMVHFGREILPVVRERERASVTAAAHSH